MLGVNPGYGSRSDLGNAAHVGTGNTLMVKRIKLLAKGFGAVSARKNAGQWFHKGTFACATGKASAMNEQERIPAKAFEVSNSAQIPPFTQKPATGAVRAKLGR